MAQLKSKSLARLSPKAQKVLTDMLNELASVEPNLSLNTSKLVSYLLIEFNDKHFEKSKQSIAYFFRNKRKHAEGRLAILTEEELEAAIKYLTKLKKVEPVKD